MLAFVLLAWATLLHLPHPSSASSGSASLNLDVRLSSYLGDGTTGGINTALGTAVDSNGNVFVVGSGSFNFGLTPQGDASNSGYILKVAANSLKPTAIFRYASKIAAVRVREGTEGLRLMVQTDLGISVLDENFHQLYTVEDNCALNDCIADLGRDGTLAVMRRKGNQIHVYTNGQRTSSLDLRAGHHHMDVAVDPVHKLVIRATFFQSYPHHVPVQVPCVMAYNYALDTEVWKDYCVSGEEDYQTQNMADSRPNHLYFSDADNRLYLGGYTDGGNSIFRLDPLEIAANDGSLHGLGVMDAPQKPHYDRYVDTWGMHGAHSISFLARYDPSNGALEEGEFLVARLSSGNGNSVSTNAVAGGGGGVLVAAQQAVASIENRNNQTINGQQTAAYGGSDAVLLVVSGDFQHRLAWHQFMKTRGHGQGVAVAAAPFQGRSRVAFLMKSKDAELISVHPWAGTGHATTTSSDQFALVILDI